MVRICPVHIYSAFAVQSDESLIRILAVAKNREQAEMYLDAEAKKLNGYISPSIPIKREYPIENVRHLVDSGDLKWLSIENKVRVLEGLSLIMEITDDFHRIMFERIQFDILRIQRKQLNQNNGEQDYENL